VATLQLEANDVSTTQLVTILQGSSLRAASILQKAETASWGGELSNEELTKSYREKAQQPKKRMTAYDLGRKLPFLPRGTRLMFVSMPRNFRRRNRRLGLALHDLGTRKAAESTLQRPLEAV
jgi:hypothetical protein